MGLGQVQENLLCHREVWTSSCRVSAAIEGILASEYMITFAL